MFILMIVERKLDFPYSIIGPFASWQEADTYWQNACLANPHYRETFDGHIRVVFAPTDSMALPKE